MTIECALRERKKAYPLKTGDFHDTKYSKMAENGVDLPTTFMKEVTSSNNGKKYILSIKRRVERGRF